MKAKRLLFLTIMALCATSAWAYTFSAVAPSGQTLYYNIVDGNAQVTYQRTSYPRYSNLSGDLVIPASVTYDNITYSVTSIGSLAFHGCTGLTSVTIGNSVTSIGSSAFSYCTGMTSVTIPNSVTFIDFQAFYHCTGLTSVTIGNSVTSIGYEAFSGCTGLTTVTIPNSVTSIGESAFEDCTGLTSVTIPNSVTSIDDGTFYGCTGLTTVTIPNSVTSIGSSAFSYCTGMTTVTIPNSVTSIGNYAFSDCTGLTSVTIPNSVTSIGDYAFAGCTSLTSVTIPNSVTSIGNNAFNGVRHIEYHGTATGSPWGAISMNGVMEGDFVYADETKQQLLKYIGNGGDVTIPSTVNVIGEMAFYGCTGLTSVTIPNSVTSIGEYAFYGCTGLTTVTIPDSVTSIGEYAFAGCTSLDTVYMMPPSPPTLGTNVFANNSSGRVFIIAGCGYDNYYTTVSSNRWYSYRNYLRSPTINFNVTVQSSNTARGIANVVLGPGNAIVRCDSTVIVHATANYGYHFDHWSNGSTANPDTIMLLGDSTITAFFAPNRYVLGLESGNPNLGTVEGSGEYDYNDTVTITAHAVVEHYHFVRWDDGNRDNPRQYVITGDATVIATFAIDTHTVSVATNDIARGMVESTGTEFVYGTPCTVTATAYTGYIFAGWSNGVNVNPYTFAVLSDVELTALFVEGEQTYTVTVVSDDPTMGTVSGGGQALDGGTVTIRAVGNPGYHFLRWNDNNTDSVRTVEVHGNVTYTAYFASNSTEAIDDVNGSNIKVYAIDGRIVVEGRENRPVWVLDMYGRVVDNGQLPSGVYLVKVGTLPARKVVVIR